MHSPNTSAKKNHNHLPKKSKTLTRGTDLQFIYEDKDIIAVEKPAGIPVISPDNRKTRNILDMVTRHIQIKNPKGRAALVHRLDRDTSGIMIFAKNAKTKAIFMKNWNRLVQKRCYIALVEGTLPHNAGTIDTWLVELNAQKVQQVPPHTRKALRAITHYKLIKTSLGFCLVELELETGRRHQIRVQMAGLGCPIAGDYLYGAQTNPFNRLCLHAHLLAFIHPYTKQLVTLASTQHNFELSN